MKGVKCIKSLKLSTILVVLFALFFTFLNVSNTFAISKDYSAFKLRVRYSSGSEYVLTDTLLYSDMVTQVKYLNGVRIEANNFGAVPSNTNYIAVTGKVNLVAQCAIDESPDTSVLNELYCPYNTGENPSVSAVSVNNTSSQWISDNISVYVTDWVKPIPNTSQYIHNRTFTYEYTFVVTNNVPASLNTLAFFLNYPGRLEGYNNRNYVFYFEGDANNKMLVDFAIDKNTAILQQQVQIQQLTLEAISSLNNSINSQSEQDAQDRDDLQNTSDDAESSADQLGQSVTNRSSSLVTIIGNFINVVIHPPQSDCIIDGDMGNMDLGDIDLCELDPPPAISVIGGFLILGMLIPLVLAVIWRFIGLLRKVVTS